MIPLVHDEVACPAGVTVIKCSATFIKVLRNPTDRWPSTCCRKIFQSSKHCISCPAAPCLWKYEYVVKESDVIPTQRTRACSYVQFRQLIRLNLARATLQAHARDREAKSKPYWQCHRSWLRRRNLHSHQTGRANQFYLYRIENLFGILSYSPLRNQPLALQLQG
jgi:hypothetical protein